MILGDTNNVLRFSVTTIFVHSVESGTSENSCNNIHNSRAQVSKPCYFLWLCFKRRVSIKLWSFQVEKDHSMIETRCLKNIVIFTETVLIYVLSRKIINWYIFYGFIGNKVIYETVCALEPGIWRGKSLPKPCWVCNF